jgi:hypothetical protein
MDAPKEAPPASIESRRSGWPWLALGALILVLAAGRVWLIGHFPEPDGDAQGHLGIAAALLKDPLSVALHWVWLPGYHYLVAGLLAVGVTARGVRLLSCAIAALLPLIVWRYARDTVDATVPRSARFAPFIAASLCAAMPIVNVLGTSAMQETLFTLLVLLTAWSIDTERFALAGGTLAAAALVRYEAWGAVGLLAGLRTLGFFPAIARRLPASLARVCRLPPVVVVPPLVAVAGWLLAHRVADGSWLGFLRELYRFTHEQNASYSRGFVADLLWFPVIEPYYLFGLTLPLFLLGARRAWRTGFVVPLGIYLFLLASYLGKGALGAARYYDSLTPFLCIAAACGACALGERWRPALPLAFAAAFAHLVRLLELSGRWTFHLRW